MLVLNKYFCKNKKSKLSFGDRVDVLNDMFYEYGGSTRLRSWSFCCISFMLAILVHAFWVSILEISQTSLGIHPKTKTSSCDYLLDNNPNWLWMIFRWIFWRFSGKDFMIYNIWRDSSNAEFRHGGCPWIFQKNYRGTQGFRTSLATIGPLTSMLKDEQSFKHGGGLL
jgi:hypothetical protein